MANWLYSGDSDLSYGGTFVRDQGHWFDVVAVTDLASACGADNMVCIDAGDVSADGRKRSELTQVLRSCGPGDDFRKVYRLGQTTRAASRAMIAQALWDYGWKDMDSTVVLFDADNGSECANCGEPIVYRDGRCEHSDAIDPTSATPEYLLCEDLIHTATAPKPKMYENGAESWPNLLPDDWANYADGEQGIRRYLSDKFDIPFNRIPEDVPVSNGFSDSPAEF